MSSWVAGRRWLRFFGAGFALALVALAAGAGSAAASGRGATSAARARAGPLAARSRNVLVDQHRSIIDVHDTPVLARNPANPANLVVVERVDRPDYSAAVQYSDDGGATWHDGALRLPAASAYQRSPGEPMMGTGMSQGASAGSMAGMSQGASGGSMTGMSQGASGGSMAGMSQGASGGSMAGMMGEGGGAGAMPTKHKLYAPVAAFGPRGILYVVFVTLSGPGNRPDGLWVESSADGGRSFGQAMAVAGPLAFQASLAVDQSSGRLYAAWLQADDAAASCNLCFAKTDLPIVAAHSDDGGRTWSAPVRVSDARRARVGAPVIAVGAGGQPAVLYVDYGSDTLDWGNLAGTYHGTFSLVMARSSDGGASFGPGRVVSSGVVPPDRFLIYLPPVPGLAVGPGGEMVAAWADARFGSPQVLVATSDPGGGPWSPPVIASGNASPASADALPALSVAPDGRIDTVYYQSAGRGGGLEVVVASSTDGGRSFSAPKRLSTAASAADVGPYVSPYVAHADFGSRISVVSTNRETLAAWTDTRDGTFDTGRQDVYFADVALAGAGAGGFPFVGVAAAETVVVLAGVALIVLARRRMAMIPAVPGPAAPVAPGAAPAAPFPLAAWLAKMVRSGALPAAADPRWGQIASLVVFSVVGYGFLHFPVSVAQVVVVIGVCVGVELGLAWRYRHRLVFPASALITGLSLGLLLRGSGLGIFVVAGAGAIVSKQLVQVSGRHVFNPSNLGLVLALALFSGNAHVTPGQWGSSWVLLFFLVNAGLVVIYSVRRFELVGSFLVTYGAFEALRLGAGGHLGSWNHVVLSASVLLFAFFMITDPRTSPSSPGARIVYAAATSALAVGLQAAGLKAGLFFALAAVCAAVPLLNRASEAIAGHPIEHFDWPTAATSEVLVGRPTEPASPLSAGANSSISAPVQLQGVGSWDLADHRRQVEVTLAAGAAVATGTSEGARADSIAPRLVAQATLAALIKLDARPLAGDIDSAAVVSLGQHRAALVAVVIVDDDGEALVAGSALVSPAGEHEAVAGAVLDATRDRLPRMGAAHSPGVHSGVLGRGR